MNGSFDDEGKSTDMSLPNEGVAVVQEQISQLHIEQNEAEEEKKEQNEWNDPETINCYVCARVIDDEDFGANNIKQTSFGLMHIQCPNKLLISNIPISMDDDALFKLFSSFGPILEAHVNGSHGLIEFESKASAQKALKKMNGFEVDKHKLVVKYAHIDDDISQQKKATKECKLRYVHSRQSLRSMSTIKLVSLLVPEKKKYREMNKKWMKLIIQHQQRDEVIEFIYNSKANDATKDFIHGYVPMPQFLESLIGESNRMN